MQIKEGWELERKGRKEHKVVMNGFKQGEENKTPEVILIRGRIMKWHIAFKEVKNILFYHNLLVSP